MLFRKVIHDVKMNKIIYKHASNAFQCIGEINEAGVITVVGSGSHLICPLEKDAVFSSIQVWKDALYREIKKSRYGVGDVIEHTFETKTSSVKYVKLKRGGHYVETRRNEQVKFLEGERRTWATAIEWLASLPKPVQKKRKPATKVATEEAPATKVATEEAPISENMRFFKYMGRILQRVNTASTIKEKVAICIELFHFIAVFSKEICSVDSRAKQIIINKAYEFKKDHSDYLMLAYAIDLALDALGESIETPDPLPVPLPHESSGSYDSCTGRSYIPNIK